MAVTIRQVAEAAKVSQATAARALSGYGSVSDQAVTKVRAAAEQLGYRPNRIAQALRSGSSHAIGLVAGDIENPFFATVARHLGDALEENGYALLVANSDEKIERERTNVETLQAHLVSGLVIAPTVQRSAPHLVALVRSGVPIVVVDRTVAGLDVDSVVVDNEEGGHRAVDHLLELGHTRVGMVCDHLQLGSTAERFAGYQRALQEHGMLLDGRLVAVAGPSREGAHEAALRLLSLPDRPTALFCSDTYMTSGALLAARELGLEIPHELSIVGFDDSDLMKVTRPSITTVQQPLGDLGRRAGELLLERLQGEEGPPRHVRLTTDLIVRESTGSPSPSQTD